MAERLPSLWRDPFRMGTRLSAVFDDFFRDFRNLGFDMIPALGRTDIYEKDRALVYETELPGMKKDDLSIKVEEGKLVVAGETKRDEEIKEENFFRMGRQYGRFQRVFPLPEDVKDVSQIRASFQDGVLKVTVPMEKGIKEKEKAIEIKVE